MSSTQKTNSISLNKKNGLNFTSKFSDLNESDEDIGFEASLDNNINPFYTSRSASSSSKWINESWRKIQQMIEERKEKSNNNKKDINIKELSNFSNDDNYEIYDIKNKNNLEDFSNDSQIQEAEEVQEGYLSFDDVSLNKNSVESIDDNSIVIVSSTNDLSPKKQIIKSSTTPVLNKDRMLEFKNSKNDKSPSFLFSKMKKNSSFERLNDLEEKIVKDNSNDNKIKHRSNLTQNKNDELFDLTKKLFSPKKNSTKTNKVPSSNQKLDLPNLKNNLLNKKSQQSIDEPIPSIPYLMSFMVDFIRNRLTLSYFTYSFCSFFIIIFAVQYSPLSSFFNGFVIGFLFTLFLFLLIFIYVMNYFFQKIDDENILHQKIITGQRWKKFPAYNKKVNENETNNSTTIHEGWFFELVYSKKLGVDRLTPAEKVDYDKMPETKAHLVYIKLEGTIIRLFVPKLDQFKKKTEMEKLSFLKVSNKMNQHNYDFSKMTTKKILLWLPKNIMNKKKYLWSKKFPIILIIEETNKLLETKKTPFNLILFARTDRDKEEWYNKFRISIEMAEQNLQIHHISTTVSTPDEVTHENETEFFSKSKSLDTSDLSHEFEHLSNYFTYETFIQDLINNYSNTNSPNQNSQTENPSQSINNLFWFNALVGRVFFDFLSHSHWTKWVQVKIQRKLSRIKLPYFIQTITLKDVNLGTSTPKFLSVANNPIIDEKGIWVDFDFDYQGGFSMTLETKINLMRLKESKSVESEMKPMKSPYLGTSNNITSTFDFDDISDVESIISLSDEDSEENLSIENDVRQAKILRFLDRFVQTKYFQQATDTKYLKKKLEEVSNLPILLTVTVYKLKGKLTINLPPPPSDRIWYGFRENPELVLDAKPAFGDREVSLNFILQILSKKLKQEFFKLLVIPNMDDIVIQVMKGNDVLINDVVP